MKKEDQTIIEEEDEFVQPDGGFGWVIVFAAFFVQFFVLGTMNNYGILFTELLDEFQESKGATSWVGSITYGLMFMSGPIATSLCERLGCRTVGIIGGVIGAIGTLLASFSNSIFKMYLTEGFLFGVGASLCYFPSVIILPQYFNKKLSLANGLVSCGSGVGTMAMGPIINLINAHYGWRTSIRLSTGLMLVVSLISCFYKTRIPLRSSDDKEESRPLFDFSIFQNKAFLMFTFALFLFMLAYFVPFVHLTQMAIEYGIPKEKASLLIGFMSVSSTFGRLFFGRMADSAKVNRLYMYQIAFLGMGVANTLCPLLTDFPGLLVYCTLFGFFEGAYVCQVAVLTGDIVGADRLAVGVGTLFGIKSIPLTLGPPLAGFLYEITQSYSVAFFVAGAMPIITACLMFAIPFLMPPPDDKFWKKRSGFASKQYLIEEESSNEDNNNNGGGRTRSNNLRPPLTNSRVSRSFTSINKYYLDVDRKVSMKDLGSIASFGSIVFSPSAVKKKSTHTFPNSNSLVVVDRVSMV